MAESLHGHEIDLKNVRQSSPNDYTQEEKPSKSSIILVVTRNAHLAEPVMQYTVNLAERLHCRLLAAYVNTLPQLWDGGQRNKRFAANLVESASVYQNKAAEKGVLFDYVQESGKISKVINRICHIVKRIEFVVIDKGVKIEEAVSRTPVPVFNIFYGDLHGSGRGGHNNLEMFLRRIPRS